MVCKKGFPIYHVVSQMLGGPSLRLGDTNEGLNMPSSIGGCGKNTGRLVTWELTLRTYFRRPENPWNH